MAHDLFVLAIGFVAGFVVAGLSGFVAAVLMGNAVETLFPDEKDA